MRIPSLWRGPILAAVVLLGVAASCPAAEPDSAYDWQVPNSKLKLPFESDTPIIFVSRSQNAAEWDKLANFWSEGAETTVDPRTARPVTRPVVRIKVPLGLGAPPIPAENPPTVAKWILGKRLYFDPILSSDGTVSCATCHDPKKGWTDQSRVSTGISGNKGGVSAPTVVNSAYNGLQFWDGRAASLEEQAQGPVQNPLEMFDGKGHAWHKAVERVRANSEYQRQFEKAFGSAPTRDAIAKSIATFERTVLSGDAINDRAEIAMRARIEDDGGQPIVSAKDFEKVLTEALAKKELSQLEPLGIADDKRIGEVAAGLARGRVLFFGKARCNSCHVGENFTDNTFHNLGVGVQAGRLPADGAGRFERLSTGHKNFDLFGAFKTPTLRAVTSSGPYMHDGSEESLAKVIDFYDRGGNANEFLDTKMRDFEAEKEFELARQAGRKPAGPPAVTFGKDEKPVVPLKLNLSGEEKSDLVLYLKSLQGAPIDPIVADPTRLVPFPGK